MQQILANSRVDLALPSPGPHVVIPSRVIVVIQSVATPLQEVCLSRSRQV